METHEASKSGPFQSEVGEAVELLEWCFYDALQSSGGYPPDIDTTSIPGWVIWAETDSDGEPRVQAVKNTTVVRALRRAKRRIERRGRGKLALAFESILWKLMGV